MPSPISSVLKAGWAASGTCVFAILVALVGGGVGYLAAPASQAAPAKDSAPKVNENVRVALKAADDSRTMFGLLNNAVRSSSTGLTSVLDGVPQIFDSVETARQGAAQVSAGLNDASTATAALDQASASTTQWSTALDEVKSLASVTTSLQNTAKNLRARASRETGPEAQETLRQADGLIAATEKFNALDAVNGLQTSLRSLRSAAQNSSASVASAQSAAQQLESGLTTITRARPSAESATAHLRTGVNQLGIVLTSVDGQLALVQNKLRDEEAADTLAQAKAAEQSEQAAPVDHARAVSWGLIAAGISGVIAYLLALAVAHRWGPRRTVSAAALSAPSTGEFPLAAVALARADDDFDTPSHGFAPVNKPTTDPSMTVQPAPDDHNTGELYEASAIDTDDEPDGASPADER